MVERLKAAVEKARAQRGAERPMAQRQSAGARLPKGGVRESNADAAWAALKTVQLDERHLENNRIITSNKKDPAYITFDVLRTRILRVFQKNGWRRVGVTSPTKGCGKTFVAANLALSMSRAQNNRTILIDMDLRLPALSKVLGVRQSDPARWFLSGETPPEDFFRLVGSNLAVGVNTDRLRDAAEDSALDVVRLENGRWFDTGAPLNLLDAGNYVRNQLVQHQRIIGSPELAAFQRGWIDADHLLRRAACMHQTDYGRLLRDAATARPSRRTSTLASTA